VWLEHDGWPVIRSLADFWASRATWKPEAKRYEIEHVTSVAESYNDVPNDTYTNASAQKVLRIAAQAAALLGVKADPHWTEVADALYVPFSAAEQRHYDFDPRVPREPWEGSTLALLMYPSLDLPLAPRIRRNDFDQVLYSLKLTHQEPHGMVAAPLSIAAASVGDADHAVAWMQNNFSSGMIKPPFNVRTETATNNTGYFATASGGFVQTLVYGFAGLRIEEQGLVEAYAPILPPTWKSMTLTNVGFRGRHYDIRIDRGADGKPRLTRKAR
jgi:trehalose/maltose hydrolase-like predicted phosphorylase